MKEANLTKQIDPWAEQANLNTAVETGAIFTHDRTGWKFKVRYVAPWSKYIGKAASIGFSQLVFQDQNED